MSTILTLLDRVRRAVLVRRRPLAALCAAVGVVAALHAQSPPPPDTTLVLTAVRDLPGGEALGSGDLTPTPVATEQVPDGALTRLDQATGRTLAAPLRAGEPVTDVRLVGPALLEGYPGLVAVPLRLPDAGAVALLRVGDEVDVVAADPQGREQPVVVATDAPVVALPRETGPVGVAAVPGALVVLATPPATADDLTQAGISRHLSVLIVGEP